MTRPFLSSQSSQKSRVTNHESRMGIEEPAFQKTLGRLDQEDFYLNREDYARFARETNDREKAVIQHMGLKCRVPAGRFFYLGQQRGEFRRFVVILGESLVLRGDYPIAFGPDAFRSCGNSEQLLQLAFFQFEEIVSGFVVITVAHRRSPVPDLIDTSIRAQQACAYRGD